MRFRFTAVGLSLVCLLATHAGFAADTCLDALGTRSYNCEFVEDSGARFTGCMRFELPGVNGDFDIRTQLNLPTGSRKFFGGCSCGAKGNLKSPAFDAAKTFDCIFFDATRTSNVLGGKASSKAITAGRLMTAQGRSTIFTCKVPRASTSPPPQPCQACQLLGEPCDQVGGPCCTGLVCRAALGHTPVCGTP